jgi:hypothetical protein
MARAYQVHRNATIFAFLRWKLICLRWPEKLGFKSSDGVVESLDGSFFAFTFWTDFGIAAQTILKNIAYLVQNRQIPPEWVLCHKSKLSKRGLPCWTTFGSADKSFEINRLRLSSDFSF